MSLMWQSGTSQLDFPFFGGECMHTIKDKLVIYVCYVNVNAGVSHTVFFFAWLICSVFQIRKVLTTYYIILTLKALRKSD